MTQRVYSLSQREHLKLIAGLSFILGLAIAVPAHQRYIALPPIIELLGPVVIPTLIMVAIWQIIRRSPLPCLHPAILVGGYFALTYGIGAIVMYNFAHFPFEAHPEYQELFTHIREQLPNASVFSLVGILGVICGATIWPSRTRRTGTQAHDSDMMPKIRKAYYWALPFIAGASFALTFLKVPVLLAYYLGAASELAGFGFFFAGFETSRSGLLKSKWLVYIACEAATIATTGMRDGARGPVLRPIVLFCIGIMIQRRKVPKKLVAICFTMALLAMPFLNAVKSSLATGIDFEQSVDAASSATHGQTIRSAVEELALTIAGRVTFYPMHLAMYANLWPSIYPFEHGQTLVWAIEGLVPRFVDPNKENQMEKFDSLPRQAGIIAANDYRTSASPDAFSEYYLNFGVLGIFLLSILHGLYFNILHRFLVIRNKDLFQLAVYAYLTLVAFPDTTVFRRFSGDSRYLLLWGAFYLFLIRSSNEKRIRRALPGAVDRKIPCAQRRKPVSPRCGPV
jgi:hypothetical protein